MDDDQQKYWKAWDEAYKPVRKEEHETLLYIGVEHSYFKDFKAVIQSIHAEIEAYNGQKNIDIKKLRTIFRSIGKSERRLYKYTSEMIEELNKIINQWKPHWDAKVGDLPQSHFGGIFTPKQKVLESLERDIKIENSNLVRYASLISGSINKLLDALDNQLKQKDLAQSKKTIIDLEKVIETAEKWLAALAVDMGKVRTINEEIHKKYGEMGKYRTPFEQKQEQALSLINEAEAMLSQDDNNFRFYHSTGNPWDLAKEKYIQAGNILEELGLHQEAFVIKKLIAEEQVTLQEKIERQGILNRAQGIRIRKRDYSQEEKMRQRFQELSKQLQIIKDSLLQPPNKSVTDKIKSFLAKQLRL